MTATDKYRKVATQVFADADLTETVPEAVEIIAAALSTAHREGFEEGMKRGRWQDTTVCPACDGQKLMHGYDCDCPTCGATGVVWVGWMPIKTAPSRPNRARTNGLCVDDDKLTWFVDGVATHWRPRPTPPLETERTA